MKIFLMEQNQKLGAEINMITKEKIEAVINI
jgi:hypothetical protein